MGLRFYRYDNPQQPFHFGGFGGGNPMDIFAQFFGGGMKNYSRP